MAEHPNVRRVRDAYAAFVAGDLDGALKEIAPDCIFHFGGDGPISGDHKGHDAIAAVLLKGFEITNGTQQFDIHGIFADDYHAIVAMRETATRADGAQLDVEEAHLLTLDADGRITNFWDLPEDPEAHERFFDLK